MKSVCLALALLLSPVPVRALEPGVAVLLHNRAGAQYEPLVRHLEEVLLAGLQQRHRTLEVYSAPRQAAVAHLALEDSGPTAAEQAMALGSALGVGAVAVGQFQIETYRIDIRLLDAQGGQVLAEHSAAGAESNIFALVDALGSRLSTSLTSLPKAVRTVAVAFFENGAAAEYGLFVRGLSGLLANELRQVDDLSLLEGKQIEKGLEHLGLPLERALRAEEVAELARWAGADAVLTGTFNEVQRLDLRLVETATAKLLAEQSTVARRSDMAARTGDLAEALSRTLSASSRSIRKVAILSFANHASGQHGDFVRGIADMLMTSLGRADRLTLIERVQVDRALANFALELSGPIDEETAVEIGAWLGADAVVLGSFIKFGELYRIDARLIDARTGELLIAQDVRGAESEVIALVDRLGVSLLARLDEREAEVKGGTGILQITFRTTKAEMGERPLYYHLCKLYIDGRYLDMSPVVGKADQDVTLFSRPVRAGKREVQVVHGYVKDGEWDGDMPEQPATFQVLIEPGATTRLRYRLEVGWFSERYVYE